MGIESIMTTNAVTTSTALNKKTLEAKIAEANKNKDAELLYMLLTRASEKDSSKKVRKDVRAQLKELKENGQISEDVYKDARKMTKNTWFRQLFLGKKDSQIEFKNRARYNEIEQVRKEGPEFSKKIQTKLNDAGIKSEDLYAIWDKYGSSGVTSDNFVNYSYKGRQPGELHEMQAHINLLAKNNNKGVDFSAQDTKKILEDMGIKVEDTIRTGKVIKDAAIGAVGAASAGFISMEQNQVGGNSLISATQNQKLTIGAAAPIVGAAIGTAYSIGKELFRVEKKVADKTVADNLKTYDAYANYIDTYATKKGKELMKNIAKYYDFESGFDRAGLEKALHEAASEDSVLNYEEARALYGALKTGTIVPKEPEQPKAKDTPENKDVETGNGNVQKKEPCTAQIQEKVVEKTVSLPTDCHKVKLGDDWTKVVNARYGAYGNDAREIVRQLKDAYFEANKDALMAQGITSSRDGFFPAVGDDLCIPSEVKTKANKVYTFDKAKDTKAASEVEKSNVKSFNGTSNPFMKKETEKHYWAETCDGFILSGKDKEALKKEAKDYEERENVEIILVE